MIGTIVNALAIAFGSLVGLGIKNGLSQRFKTIITQAVGLSVLYVGLSGAISRMILPEAHSILFIISLVLGGMVGEAIDIEEKLEGLGKLIEKKIGDKGSGSISQGFVSASLLFCVGSMAIIGALESGIQGQHQTLFAKGLIDGVTSIILASSYGIGVMLSAVSVFIYQGAITILSTWIEPYLTADMIREISIVGGIMISGLGLDLLGIKKIKVGNLLPAILVPVIYYLILSGLSMG